MCILLPYYHMVAALNQHRQSASPYAEHRASVNCGLTYQGKGKKDQLCKALNHHSELTFLPETVFLQTDFALNTVDTTLIILVRSLMQLFGSPGI